jgi:hypothetical protein
MKFKVMYETNGGMADAEFAIRAEAKASADSWKAVTGRSSWWFDGERWNAAV